MQNPTVSGRSETIPTGTGYGRPAPSYNKRLAEVGPGTPMGEYFRRYWHPIGISSELTDLPKRFRFLCEDLILFRDKKGRAGCVLEYCTHRQASLFYGRVEEDGIRCCYHGWLFDVEGRCLHQAMEVGGGKHRDKVRQPWYPVQERYGLVFVYMGPPEKMPLLPRYDFMENLGPDEHYERWFDSLPGGNIGPVNTNWLVDQDNICDLAHAPWLHHLHSGPQFGPMFAYVTMDNVGMIDSTTDYPECKRGILVKSEMPGPRGEVYTAYIETQYPNVRVFQPPIIPGKPTIINWILPTDDHNHIALNLVRVSPVNKEMMTLRSEVRDDPEWMQRHPSDHQAQFNPTQIEMHSEEHLSFTDRGVVKMRRIYERQLQAMERGEPLLNLAYQPGEELFSSEGGVELKSPPPAGGMPETKQLKPQSA